MPHPNENVLILVLMQMDPDFRVRWEILRDHRHPDTRRQLRIDLDRELASIGVPRIR